MTRTLAIARRPLALAAALLALTATAVAAKPAKMDSTPVGPLLCETTGGGKFVPIPGFPGEKVDRRLLGDIRWIVKRYPIFITDGYSMSDVHSREGEHPLGLALDIVPNEAEGGTWADITRLARWAEPRRNRPRAPFRWVGYDGDSGHGRGNHLHLSWGHNDRTKPKKPAKWVLTRTCPGGGDGGGGGDDGGGGISPRSTELNGLAPAYPEPHEHAEPVRPY
ncbi:MAG TPA: hypothetical protein VD765_05580 [Solirubrobacterales bacterium]|nr:hypothetical protein [Solirubrobacterales bacterium]